MAKKQYAKQRHTDPFADAPQIGQAILTKNATNVGFCLLLFYLLSLVVLHSKRKTPFCYFYSYLLDECQVNDDCPYNKECKQNECRDPCVSIICGRRAECKAESHRAVCYCPPGMQGNPLIACTEVGCTSNSECSSQEKCDYSSPSSTKKECIPLCGSNPCTSGASCSANNHREICACNYPLQGDGYVSCTESKD